MLAREITATEKQAYNSAVAHPLQSWEWGEFRKKTGVQIERLGFFENGILKHGLQVSFHEIPILGGTAGYLPKGFAPNSEQLRALKQLGQQHQSLFIKLEPQVENELDNNPEEIKALLQKQGAVLGRPLFTRYTYILDLTPNEEELLAGMDSKTRYNTKLAEKKGVKIFEDSSQQGLEEYLKILHETTKRQAFYAHSPEYFQTMWETLKDSGMMRIFHAEFDNQIIVSWIMFVFNGVLYYPYGASRSIHRNVMASNLMMWEMIKFGKRQGCHKFDMWGSLGPNPDSKNPWYGFHKFKKGYGGKLTEYLGTYDLVLNNFNYKIFRLADTLRWKYLRLKKKFT